MFFFDFMNVLKNIKSYCNIIDFLSRKWNKKHYLRWNTILNTILIDSIDQDLECILVLYRLWRHDECFMYWMAVREWHKNNLFHSIWKYVTRYLLILNLFFIQFKKSIITVLWKIETIINQICDTWRKFMVFPEYVHMNECLL